MTIKKQLFDFINENTTPVNKAFMEAVMSGYTACFEAEEMESPDSVNSDDQSEETSEDSGNGDDMFGDDSSSDDQQTEEQAEQDAPAGQADGANEQPQDVNATPEKQQPQQRTAVSGEELIQGMVKEHMTDKILNVAKNSPVKVTKESELQGIISKGVNTYIQGKNLQAPSEEVVKKIIAYFDNDIHKRIEQAKQQEELPSVKENVQKEQAQKQTQDQAHNQDNQQP